MMKTITPPKGVTRVATADEPHVDEGHELHDCEGEEEAMDLLLNEELKSNWKSKMLNYLVLPTYEMTKTMT